MSLKVLLNPPNVFHQWKQSDTGRPPITSGDRKVPKLIPKNIRVGFPSASCSHQGKFPLMKHTKLGFHGDVKGWCFVIGGEKYDWTNESTYTFYLVRLRFLFSFVIEIFFWWVFSTEVELIMIYFFCKKNHMKPNYL